MLTKPLFLGFNFKEILTTTEDVQKLLEVYYNQSYKSQHEIVVFLSHPFLLLGSLMVENKAHFAIGAQDVSQFIEGSHTGEVSVQTLQDFGVKYALIAHSEVRDLQKLQNDQIAQKITNCLQAQIVPVICVGYEKSPETGKLDLLNLEKQIDSVIKNIPTDYTGSRLVWAFEPTFAIGSGILATREQIQDAVELIWQKSKQFDTTILYGGSVNSTNYGEFLDILNLDGFLIGKASADESEVPKFLE
jgi:triosephosphate isomerase